MHGRAELERMGNLASGIRQQRNSIPNRYQFKKGIPLNKLLVDQCTPVSLQVNLNNKELSRARESLFNGE